MPRPRSLTHEAIAVAALAVIDRDGTAGLSMRAVATELGVGTMSLYRYVDDRDQLEQLVVALVLEAVDPDLPARGSWRRRVAILLERIRDAVGDHPAVVPLLLTRRHTAEPVMRCGEALVRALADGGFGGKQRVIAFRALLAYTIGAIQVEHFGPLSGPGTVALAALPAADYPFLSDTARHAQQVAAEEEFRRGLGIVLAGLGPGAQRSTAAAPKAAAPAAPAASRPSTGGRRPPAGAPSA